MDDLPPSYATAVSGNSANEPFLTGGPSAPPLLPQSPINKNEIYSPNVGWNTTFIDPSLAQPQTNDIVDTTSSFQHPTEPVGPVKSAITRHIIFNSKLYFYGSLFVVSVIFLIMGISMTMTRGKRRGPLKGYDSGERWNHKY